MSASSRTTRSVAEACLSSPSWPGSGTSVGTASSDCCSKANGEGCTPSRTRKSPSIPSRSRTNVKPSCVANVAEVITTLGTRSHSASLRRSPSSSGTAAMDTFASRSSDCSLRLGWRTSIHRTSSPASPPGFSAPSKASSAVSTRFVAPRSSTSCSSISRAHSSSELIRSRSIRMPCTRLWRWVMVSVRSSSRPDFQTGWRAKPSFILSIPPDSAAATDSSARNTAAPLFHAPSRAGRNRSSINSIDPRTSRSSGRARRAFSSVGSRPLPRFSSLRRAR